MSNASLRAAARYAERQNASAGQRAADYMEARREATALDELEAEFAELRARLDARKVR